MTRKHTLITIFMFLFIIFLTLLGFGLLGISFLSFELVKSKVDALAPDGKAIEFTVALFEQISIRSRFIGIALCIASVILSIVRKQTQVYLYNILESFSDFSSYLLHLVVEIVRKEERVHLFTLSIVLLLAVVSRLFFLFQPMRYDEAFTFTNYASKTLFIALSNYSYPNNHPFHTLLVHIAYVCLGNQQWVIRLPVYFVGILLVIASYVVIRIFYNKDAALLTAGFVASSPALILYSTNARGYMLVYFIFLLILSLGTYILDNRNFAAVFLFAILSSLGFYTIPVMLYPFGVVIVWLFLSIIFHRSGLDRTFTLWNVSASLLIMVLLTLLLYIPVIIVSGLDSVVGNRFVTSKSWSYFASNILVALRAIWYQWNENIPTVIRFFLVVGFFASLVFYRRLTTYRVPIVLAVAVWCIPVLMLQRVIPPARVWLFLLPLYFGVASSGVTFLLRPVELESKHYRSVILSVITIVLSICVSSNTVYTRSVYYSTETGTLRDAEKITVFLKDYLKPRDRVLAVCPSDSPLEYYFNLYGIPVTHLFADVDSEHHRIVVVVNETEHQTMGGILEEKGLGDVTLSIPRIMQQYQSATLYEIGRSE